MSQLIRVLLFSFVFDIPKSDLIHCDVIEKNHIYDQRGVFIFTQCIFWVKYSSGGLNRTEFRPHGFRMLDRYREIEKCNGYYRYVPIGETYQERPIEVRAPIYKESWTHIDPEATARRLYWKDEAPDLILNYINLRRKVIEPEKENLEDVLKTP